MKTIDECIKKFGDDSQYISLSFSHSEWAAVFDNGKVVLNAAAPSFEDALGILYKMYCDRYSPKKVAESLFDLLETIENTSDVELAKQRHLFLEKDKGEFIWRDITPLPSSQPDTQPASKTLPQMRLVEVKEDEKIEYFYIKKNNKTFYYSSTIDNSSWIEVWVGDDYSNATINQVYTDPRTPDIPSSDISTISSSTFESMYDLAINIINKLSISNK